MYCLKKIYKFKTYKDQNIVGLVTRKLDGVQCIKYNGQWLSRANKPLYNLPMDFPDGIYEYYNKNWETSISDVRTRIDGESVCTNNLYSLYPAIDSRLKILEGNLTPTIIKDLFNKEIESGFEGLIIYDLEYGLYKIKGKETYDVEVIGYIEGKGKHLGKMGALMTKQGKIGTGFTDQMREDFTEDFIVGKVIEVEYMELTPRGKFRHPRFVRLRLDKST